jgi:WD40 repeat protein
LGFSKDGRILATASAEGELLHWDFTSGERLSGCSLPGTWRIVLPVRFSPDLSLAACGTDNGRLRLIDTRTGQERWSAHAAEESLRCLAFSPDGLLLASGAGYVESAIRLWDVRTGRELGRLEGHRSWVSSLVFWPDGKTLASGSADQTIRFWDLASLTAIDTLRGHQLEVWSLALSPDTHKLLSGSKDGSVYAWDAQLPRVPRRSTRTTLPDGITTWQFTSDSQAVLAVDRDGHVAHYGGANYGRKQVLLDLGGPPHWADFSVDGQFLVTARRPDVLEVWSLGDRRQLLEITLPPRGAFPVTVLPRSNHLLTRDYRDSSFHEWDLATGEEIRTWLSEPLPAMPRFFAFSLDEQWFATADDVGVGRIRDMKANREWPVDLALKQLADLVVSPDGRLLAAVSGSGNGGLWETQTNRRIATLRGFVLGMTSAAFSPNGKRLAVGSNGDEAVKLWDVEGVHELLTLRGEGSLFMSVDFSPDGNTLAAANAIGTLHLWDPPSAAEIEVLELPKAGAGP